MVTYPCFGGNFFQQRLRGPLWIDLVWMNDFDVGPRSQSHLSLSEEVEPRLAFPPHFLLLLGIWCFALNTRLGTAASSSAFWHQFVLQPRSRHLGWHWSENPVILRCPLAPSFCALNGSSLTIKWVWPLSRKGFQYYYLWRAKHRIFASVSRVVWRGFHLQVHVKEAVRYLTS